MLLLRVCCLQCKTQVCSHVLQQHVDRMSYKAGVWLMGHTSSDPTVDLSPDATRKRKVCVVRSLTSAPGIVPCGRMPLVAGLSHPWPKRANAAVMAGHTYQQGVGHLAKIISCPRAPARAWSKLCRTALWLQWVQHQWQ